MQDTEAAVAAAVLESEVLVLQKRLLELLPAHRLLEDWLLKRPLASWATKQQVRC